MPTSVQAATTPQQPIDAQAGTHGPAAYPGVGQQGPIDAQPGTHGPAAYPGVGQQGPIDVQPGTHVPAAPVVTRQVVTLQAPPESVSFTGHIAFSCCVFWCCGWLFGAIAFFLAGRYTSDSFISFIIIYYINFVAIISTWQ